MTLPQWLQRVRWPLIVVAATLMALGCLGIDRSDQFATGIARHAERQAIHVTIALIALGLVMVPSYRALCRHSYAILGGTLLLLVAVYFFPAVNGAHRWIRFGPLSIQPSEFAKVAYVLALARYLMYRENYRTLRGLIAPLAITVLPVVLILREPDLGTAAVFLPLLFVMLFVAGARRHHLTAVVAAGLLLTPLLWTQMSAEQKSRVTSLLNQTQAGERPNGDAYHLHQAKRMLALGGVWGSAAAGDAVDDPAAYHLPEARTDFIFCVLGERFGLPGLALVLVLYGLLVWQGLRIATATREPFGRLVAVGLVTLIAIQVLINTGMTVGLLPITGLSLPLVSYGGSGLLAHAIAVGLLINIGMRPGYEVTREPFRFAVG